MSSWAILSLYHDSRQVPIIIERVKIEPKVRAIWMEPRARAIFQNGCNGSVIVAAGLAARTVVVFTAAGRGVVEAILHNPEDLGWLDCQPLYGGYPHFTVSTPNR